MNIRQAKYKSNRLKGMNIYNASRAAGYSEAYSRNARAEKVVEGCTTFIKDVFEQAGFTDKAVVAHALEGLNANKVISANIIASEGMKDAHSMTKDFIDVPDWNARHKYYNTILEMTDRIKQKVEHSGSVNTGTNIIVVRADATKPDTISGSLSTPRLQG